MIYLGPYQPSTDPSAPGWALPVGMRCALDLRSDAARGTAGVALFVGDGVLGSDYTNLGDWGDVLSPRARSAWESLVGSLPAGASPIDAAWHAFTEGSDPTGANGPSPLMPGTRRRQLTLSVDGQKLRSRRWQGAADPMLGRVVSRLSRDLNAARAQARRGETRDESGQVDTQAHRRLLRWHSRKLGVADEAVRPAEWPAAELGIEPRTTVSDDFNRADASDLGANWTTAEGRWLIRSNAARANDVDVAAVSCLAYYNSAVSGVDHECQYTLSDTNVSHSTTSPVGPLARHTGTSTFTAYYLRMRLSDGLTQLYSVTTGNFTPITSSSAPAWAVGDVIKLDCDGDQIGTYRNGTGILSSPNTDTAITTGTSGGMRAFDDDAGADDWSLTDLGAASAFPALYYHAQA